MTTAATAPRRASFRRGALACVLLASLTAPTVPAAAAPTRAVVGDLRGVTTVTWSGNAAIRLRVPKNVLVPESGYRLTLREGRFVSVRAVPVPQPIGCKRDFGQDWCVVSSIDWLRDLAETGGHGTYDNDPARDFDAALTDPPLVMKGMWDLYLFTDRTATLEITTAGLGGRASYVAAGRFAGQAMATPGPCRLADCTTGMADQRYGGASFDVGRAGLVQALSYAQIKEDEFAPNVGAQQSFLLRTCAYPSSIAPDASPEPADHPTGCDVTGGAPKDTAYGAVNEGGSALPAKGRVIRGVSGSQVSGRVYLGFRATSIGPGHARLGGLLLWMRYGIR